MLLYLIQFFLCLRGRPINYNRSWTPVTNGIENLPIENKWVLGLLASLAHGLPVTIAITLFVILRRDFLRIDSATSFIPIYISISWAWVGPILIWRYETTWTNRFLFRCASTLDDATRVERIAQAANTSVFAHWSNWIVLVCWVGWTIFCYIHGIRFFYRNPVTDTAIFDLWWLGMLSGVAIYAVYTGIGLLLSIKTIRLTHLLSQMTINLDPYDNDERGGLAFVGRYARRTSESIASGWVFIPLLLWVNLNFVRENGYLIYSSITLYSIWILCVFLTPVFLIHYAIVRQKQRRIGDLRATIWRLFQQINATGAFDQYVRYRIEHNLLIDTRNIKEWPFKLPNMLPALAAAISAVLASIARHWLSSVAENGGGLF
jgi:hypothetical protein